MYRWWALLILTFSITGASAEDEIPDVVNETSIDPPSEDDDSSEITDEVLMVVAAAVLGVCIIIAALIMRK